MPKVRYIANIDATEGTNILRLKKGDNNQPRLLAKGGAPLEITDHEYQKLRGRYELQVVDAPQPVPLQDLSAPVVPAQPEPVASSTPLQSTTSSTLGGSSDEHPETP